jgi:hypothetical protein
LLFDRDTKFGADEISAASDMKRANSHVSFAKMLSGANAFKISGIHRNVTMSHRVENRSMTRFVGAR